MRKDYSYWLISLLLVMIIVFTNPFSTEKNGYGSNLINEYNKIKLISDFSTLSDTERLKLADEYLEVARLYSIHDKHDKAINFASKAIELNKNKENIYNNLASAYLSRAFFEASNNINEIIKSPDFEVALESGRKNIATFPDSAKSYDGLINTYVSVKDFDRAIEVAKQGCYSNPNLSNRCKKVADLYLLSGHKQKAITFYLELSNNPTITDPTWIYKKLGAIYHADGQCNLSNKYFKMVYEVQATSENMEALFDTCYEKKNKKVIQ